MTKIIYKDLHKNIKKIRVENDMTQSEFGEIICRDGSTIKRYESGRYRIPKIAIKAICNKFGQDIEKIIARDLKIYLIELRKPQNEKILNEIDEIKEIVPALEIDKKEMSNIIIDALACEIKRLRIENEKIKSENKDDYERLLKFDKKNIKAFDIIQQQEIKNKSKLGASQRVIAKEYKTSVATINKIISNRY